MELRVLRYFLAIAKEESFSEAAASLNLTQPTLSRQIKELETELGVTLLNRTRNNKRITLTEAGLFLQKKAEELLNLADKTTSAFENHNSNISGDIYIGAGELPAMSILAEAASRLQENFPDIRYHLHSGNAQYVTENLDNGILDFGVLVGSVNLEKYNYIKLSQVTSWSLLIHQDDPLSKLKIITPLDISNKPLILSRQALESNELIG